MKKFELGTVLSTVAIADRVTSDPYFSEFVLNSLGRYIYCDWGDTCDSDKKLNDESVENGDTRIVAVYIYKKTNEKIWIITEWDRSATTILFPHEY